MRVIARVALAIVLHWFTRLLIEQSHTMSLYLAGWDENPALSSLLGYA
jgi:hypothetical protein